MNLARARELAVRVKEAEAAFDRGWKGLRNGLLVPITLIVLPLLVYLSTEAVEGALGLPVVLILAAALYGGVFAGSAALAEREKRRQGMRGGDAAVLQACADLEPLTAEIAAPLETALGAYLALGRIAADRAWKQQRIDVQGPLLRSASQLVDLIHWGGRLSRAAESIRRAAPDGSLDREYARQLDRLRAAAEAFRRLEAAVARAYLAISGASQATEGATDAMREVAATFDALSELIEPEADSVTPHGRAGTGESVLMRHRAR